MESFPVHFLQVTPAAVNLVQLAGVVSRYLSHGVQLFLVGQYRGCLRPR